MAFEIKKANKGNLKLRLLISGLSGSGKTFGALTIAKGMGLIGHGKTVVIDTEKSASHYSDQFEFDVLELDAPYSPERYIEAIEYAESLGYQLIIIDSITHEWGFAIDAVSRMEGRNGIKNWGDYKNKRRVPLINKLLKPNTHIICTGRVKSAYDEVEDSRGKSKLTKVGTQLKQEDGLEYEFDIAIELDRKHFYTCSKTRAQQLESMDPLPLTEDTGKSIMDWLTDGKPVEEVKELSKYAKGVLDKINKASADDIASIGTRLDDKEVIDKLSPDEHVRLKTAYQAKAESIESEY